MGTINESYVKFYKKRNPKNIYPTEFVVRTFLASYPDLKLSLKPFSKVLDIGFGDGRNTAFLVEQGYEVYGIEIAQEIVDLTTNRLNNLGLGAQQLKVGCNSNIPFEDNFFDIVLGCHVTYYCNQDECFKDNIHEISRVMKKGAWFITSLADKNSYIFNGGEFTENGHVFVKNDPYHNRQNCKFRAFSSQSEIIDELSGEFVNFSFGKSCNNYYGIDERVFWVVCQKK